MTSCSSWAGQQARSQLAGCHNPVLVLTEESAGNVTDCKVPLAAALNGSRERRTVMDGNAPRRRAFKKDFVLYELD